MIIRRCEWGFCSGGYFCRVLAERGLSVFFPFLIDHAGDVLVVILSEVVQMILHAKNFVWNLGKCLRVPRFEMRGLSSASVQVDLTSQVTYSQHWRPVPGAACQTSSPQSEAGRGIAPQGWHRPAGGGGERPPPPPAGTSSPAGTEAQGLGRSFILTSGNEWWCSLWRQSVIILKLIFILQ